MLSSYSCSTQMHKHIHSTWSVAQYLLSIC